MEKEIEFEEEKELKQGKKEEEKESIEEERGGFKAQFKKELRKKPYEEQKLMLKPEYYSYKEGFKRLSLKPQKQDNKDQPELYCGEEKSYCEDYKYEEVKGNTFVSSYEDPSPVMPNDIIQGLVGDCYFMSSLAAIAKTDPQLIYEMIKDNKDGTWTVRFYSPKSSFLDGIFGKKKIEVKVDNLFPVDKRTKMPVYANYKYKGDKYKEGGNIKAELWPMIIEKAWTKIKGSYKEIHGGDPGKAMKAITGEEIKEYRIKSMEDEEILKTIESALLKGNPVVASTYEWNKKEEKENEKIPLFPNHAYAVLEVQGNKINLYNPHGKDHPPLLTVEEFKKYFQWLFINKK